MSRIEKILESKGNLTEAEYLKRLGGGIETMQQMLAQKDRSLEFDSNLLEAIEALKNQIGKPGENTADFIKRLSGEEIEIIRLQLDQGGSVKGPIKRPVEVKKINLTDEFLKTTEALSKLSPRERDRVMSILRKTMPGFFKWQR